MMAMFVEMLMLEKIQQLLSIILLYNVLILIEMANWIFLIISHGIITTVLCVLFLLILFLVLQQNVINEAMRYL